MQRIRDLLFAFLLLLIAALIQVIIFLANPYYWPFLKALWLKLHFWAVVLTILATIALICLILWVIRTAFRVIGRMDKTKDEQRIAEMKEVFKQALKEVGLAKGVEGEQQSEDKSKKGRGESTKPKLRSK